MNIELRYQFTDACSSALVASGAKSPTFPGNANVPSPVVGDLLSFAHWTPIVFRVVQRELHWAAQDHLIITYTLDLPGDFLPDRQRKAAAD